MGVGTTMWLIGRKAPPMPPMDPPLLYKLPKNCYRLPRLIAFCRRFIYASYSGLATELPIPENKGAVGAMLSCWKLNALAGGRYYCICCRYYYCYCVVANCCCCINGCMVGGLYFIGESEIVEEGIPSAC